MLFGRYIPITRSDMNIDVNMFACYLLHTFLSLMPPGVDYIVGIKFKKKSCLGN